MESGAVDQIARHTVGTSTARRAEGREDGDRCGAGETSSIRYDMTVPVRPGVLFDVDGTLVDSNYLHALSWARALRDAGEWAPMNAIHRLVGMGGDQLINELLGHECPDAQAARPKHYEALKGDIVPFPDAGK